MSLFGLSEMIITESEVVALFKQAKRSSGNRAKLEQFCIVL
jgi:hypothetical protein